MAIVSKCEPVSPEDRTIGMIGLGLLGSAVGVRLRRAGFTTVGFDIDSGRRDKFHEQGGIVVSSVSDAVRPKVILCLPDSSAAARVLEKIKATLAAGAIVIDLTTGDPIDAEQNAEHLKARGIRYLDATVGGSSKQTLEGEVIVMAGGDPGAFNDCADLFAAYARETFYAGGAGSGARMKLVLNLALGLNRAVLAEALAFARALGIDGETALTILKAGPAYSTVMDVKGRKMICEDFTAEARLSQHLKDVGLIIEAARQTGALVPLSEVHRRLLENAESRGYGASDNSAIIKAYLPE